LRSSRPSRRVAIVVVVSAATLAVTPACTRARSKRPSACPCTPAHESAG
jgi:hypothetical protein